MPEHVWSVLCYKGVLDQYTNQVSLLDVVENLNLEPDQKLRRASAKDKIVLDIEMQIVTLWARSDPTVPEQFEFRSILVLPDGTEVVPKEVPRAIDLNQHRRLRLFTRIRGLRFIGVGLYKMLIQWREPDKSDEWTTATTLPLEVMFHEAAKEPEPEKGSRRKAKK